MIITTAPASNRIKISDLTAVSYSAEPTATAMKILIRFVLQGAI